ncbi:TetR family transcriptional regulator C-terminal domain-containing protein [Streptomyces longisporoflavus]|uniref:TetR family transcriptional regulator C-terminal domain-containing protein n=1 Tax=Streptomyces longisporoflavus TaxID=28044 RepID=UPI0035713671
MTREDAPRETHGCFFYGVIAEFDVREGAVHDALVHADRDWNGHTSRPGRVRRRRRSGARVRPAGDRRDASPMEEMPALPGRRTGAAHS